MSAMNGALVIDKPAGWTSHDVVARVRKIIGERRIGHTGTLDPFATGVLVLLIGQATRLGQFLSDAEKEYEAVFRLGYATDTGDGTGTRINDGSNAVSASPPAERGSGGEGGAPRTPPSPRTRGGEMPSDSKSISRNFRQKEIEAAIASLRGGIVQTPPMYSAKKIGGRKLYEFARAGTEVERTPVTVNILEFETLTSGDLTLDSDGTVDLPVRVVCSAGTYIRTLAEDFAKCLGIGAHVHQLRRTRAGRFKIENALTLDRLEKVANDVLAEAVISPDAVLSHLPAVQLSDEDAIRARQGIDLKIEEADCSGWDTGQTVRMRSAAGNLIAVGKYSQAERIVHPSVVINEQ